MEFLETLPEWLYSIIWVACLIITALFSVINSVRCSSQNKSKLQNQKSIMEELEKMQYRLPSYREDEQSSDKQTGQTFETVVPQYKLDDKKGVLVQDGVRDLVAEAQEGKDSALSAMLDKFGFPSFVQPSAPIQGTTDEPEDDPYVSLLDDLQASYSYFDDIKAKYGLDPHMTPYDVMEYLRSNSANISKTFQKKEVTNYETSVQTTEEKKPQ